jgi:hypothetical protein
MGVVMANEQYANGNNEQYGAVPVAGGNPVLVRARACLSKRSDGTDNVSERWGWTTLWLGLSITVMRTLWQRRARGSLIATAVTDAVRVLVAMSAASRSVHVE